MKKGIILLTLLLISTNVNSANASNEILLKSRRFIPAEGISDAAKAKIEAIPQRAHILIQLEQIPTIKERKELESNGIKLLSYIPNKAWFASIPSDKASEIAALANVRAMGEILPEDRISPVIRQRGVGTYARNEDGTVKLTVVFFKDVALDDAVVVIANHGGSVIGRAPIINALEVTIPEGLVTTLANEDAVQWINEFPPPPELYNDGSRAAIGVDTVQAPPYNLTGAGVVVGEWDGGWVDTTHDDLAGRVTIGDSGSSTSAHATHVAGTMLGDGTKSEDRGGTPYQWKGMATEAKVISYEWWNTVSELNTEYDSAINTYGIDISQNSWGQASGVYNERCQAVDCVVTGRITRPVAVIWAAGNYGGSGFDSIGNPSSAKDIITVGASYSDLDEVTCFSSLGPTSDGRIKPDVVAPGDKTPCEGNGIKSTVPGNTYADFFYYGTSMAAPAVSGSVALMLEYWEDTHSSEGDPLPSTMKAILIETATDLGNTGPDYSYGYGRINADEAIYLIDDDTLNDVILEDSIIEQADIDTFTVDVPEGQSELKITLVWDDYPGDPAAAKALVNDLDLIVIAPDESTWEPWTLDPTPGNEGDPAVRNEDHLNNVEQVSVTTTDYGGSLDGIWTIEISGTTVPVPKQTYSLVTNKDLNIAVGASPPIAFESSITTEADTPVQITLKATDEGLPAPPGTLSYIITSLPSNGTLSDPGAGTISSVPYTLVGNGNQVIYTPDASHKGQDSFAFRADDGGTAPDGGDSDEATVKIFNNPFDHWWKFDTGSGSTAYDSVGSNNGSLEGNPEWVSGVTGQAGDYALDFDGDDYVDLLGSIPALEGDTVTITAWINAETLNHKYHPIMTQYEDTSYNGYYFCVYEVDSLYDYYIPTFYLNYGNEAMSYEMINTDQWYHLGGTYDGSCLRIYVNGILRGIYPLAANSGVNHNAYIAFDDNYFNFSYFDGKIDDVRVYRWALRQDEIWELMIPDTSKFCIKNNFDEPVAWFDDLGNLFLEGTLATGVDPLQENPGHDEFRVQDSSSNDVAIIDATNGNMYIKGKGSKGDWPGPGPSGGVNEFIVESSTGTVAYITDSGDLYLKGKLFDSTIP